jgi:hypothetical protein
MGSDTPAEKGPQASTVHLEGMSGGGTATD